jgi:hypothetical protein
MRLASLQWQRCGCGFSTNIRKEREVNHLKTLSEHYVLAVLLLVTLVLATACGPAAPLTEETLKNSEYGGIYQETVQLTDGVYAGEPFVEGGASRPTVTYMEPTAFGDLDGDGVEDAAVLLVENSGGSGSFVYLAAVLNGDGNPENVATTLLVDRAQVQSLTVDGGRIAVGMVIHGPDDPMCCPTQEVEQVYELVGDALVQK